MTYNKYYTHKQIDEDYINRGIFTKGQIGEMNNQFEQVGLVLMESQSRAKQFLRHRMGIIKYTLWKIFAGFPYGVGSSYGFGYDGWVEKAKEYGWRDELKEKKIKEIMQIDNGDEGHTKRV